VDARGAVTTEDVRVGEAEQPDSLMQKDATAAVVDAAEEAGDGITTIIRLATLSLLILSASS
jgi:hypothetical protein